MLCMATTQEKLLPAEVAEAVRSAGGLIGVTAAARLLGIRAPNFRRDMGLVEGMEPKITELEVEGSASVYLRGEVQALAKRRRNARSNGH